MHAAKLVTLREGAEVIVSYLPLSHIAAQILDIFLPLMGGLSVYFAQPDAMKVSDPLGSIQTLYLGCFTTFYAEINISSRGHRVVA